MSAPGLIQKFREVASARGLGRNTVNTYIFWLRKFHGFIGKRASEWRGPDVTAWMHDLEQQHYSFPSRNQGLCSLIFTFKHVLRIDPGCLDLPPRPREQRRIKTIPSREELGRIFTGLSGQSRVMAGIMYGSGLRVEETCKLRVQDLDFAALTIRVHSGKGDKDRLTLLPTALVPILQRWLTWRSALHEWDLGEGAGLVELPNRLGSKYPNAKSELRWQFLFPSRLRRGQYRWHTTPESIGKSMRQAVAAAGLTKRVTPHTLRHAFATHALRAGNDIATVQDLLGHSNVETTMIYLHGDGARGVSPLDAGPIVPLRRLPSLTPQRP